MNFIRKIIIHNTQVKRYFRNIYINKKLMMDKKILRTYFNEQFMLKNDFI